MLCKQELIVIAGFGRHGATTNARVSYGYGLDCLNGAPTATAAYGGDPANNVLMIE